MGRCYQKLRKPREAIGSFQEYLAKAPNLSEGERGEIQGYIHEMEALKAEQEEGGKAAAGNVAGAPTGIPPGAPAAAPGSAASGSAAASDGSAEAAVAPTAGTTPEAAGADSAGAEAGATLSIRGTDTDRGHGFRVAGLATGAVGIAAVGVGIAFGIATLSAASDVEHQYDPDRDSDGRRNEKLQWVGYGIGVAALATGAALYWYGRADAGEAQAAHESDDRGHPTASVGAAGATVGWQGRF